MGHSTGESFEMEKLIRNLSCFFFFYSFSSFASQITILYYLNFIWLKYSTFISAELFCTTIKQAQFHGQGGTAGAEGAVTPNIWWGAAIPLCSHPPPSLQGCRLVRTASSEDQNWILRKNNTPQL